MQPSPVFFAASGAHLGESLVSSCSSSSDPYRRSMLRLLDYVGLQHYGTPQATLPPRSSAEDAAIARHEKAVREAQRRHDESVQQRNIRISKKKLIGTMAEAMKELSTVADSSAAPAIPTIYLSFEDSIEWKAFLTDVAPADRLAVTVRRRLTVELWKAHQRDTCLWCWFPRNMCMCAQLDAYKAQMPAKVLDQHVEVTMLLHSEELMRSTNSGHVAAYLLGAPLRVWGMDADDFYLRELGPLCQRPAEPFEELSRSPFFVVHAEMDGAAAAAAAAAAAGTFTVSVYNVSLYPSSESVLIDDFIRERHFETEAPPPPKSGDGGKACRNAAPETKEAEGRPDSTTEGAKEQKTPPSPSPAHPHKKVHLILLDSTWGQALSLNRKLSRCIPRVKLHISTQYESLFQALRKRTRETGVSTLEATSMAVEQCVRAMGYVTEAAQTSKVLTRAMKNFVDARCLLKYASAQFTTDGETLDAFRDKRDDARREDAARRQILLAEKMTADEEARKLRLPPVLNYCYCCDCVTGWHRTGEHVMGRAHRAALAKNPTCAPSEASRSVVVPDFSRPTRAERLAAAGDGKREPESSGEEAK